MSAVVINFLEERDRRVLDLDAPPPDWPGTAAQWRHHTRGYRQMVDRWCKQPLKSWARRDADETLSREGPDAA
jgi:hypothetical protein